MIKLSNSIKFKLLYDSYGIYLKDRGVFAGVYNYALVHPDGWYPESHLCYMSTMASAVRIAKGLPPIGVGLRLNDYIKDYQGNRLCLSSRKREVE